MVKEPAAASPSREGTPDPATPENGEAPQLTIVIPTYNEQVNIVVLLEQLANALATAGVPSEVIVVDDDSPDRTWEVAQALTVRYRWLRVIHRTEEKGIASAWRTGCCSARGAYVAFMDADLAHSPTDLLRLYHYGRDQRVDMVIGSRYLTPGVAMPGKSFAAVFASRLAQRIMHHIIGVPGSDITHSFRVFRRDVFAAVDDELRSRGNAFLAELTHRARQRGFGVAELPVQYGRRIHGKTKLSLLREGIRFLFRIVVIRAGR